jgi:hypothetical protein
MSESDLSDLKHAHPLTDNNSKGQNFHDNARYSTDFRHHSA